MRVIYDTTEASIASGKSYLLSPFLQILHAANCHMEKSTERILDTIECDASHGLLFM